MDTDILKMISSGYIVFIWRIIPALFLQIQLQLTIID